MATGGYYYGEHYESYEYTTTHRHKKDLNIFQRIKCFKWLWKNREWSNTKQKFKQMEKECNL